MSRLITIDDIRKYRPVAQNISEARAVVYIDEAERLDILPAIGGEIFRELHNVGYFVIDEEGTELQDENGVRIVSVEEGDLPTDLFKLLNGGYWEPCEGALERFEGLKAAECYFAYARMVRNNQYSVTPFGVVVKQSDESVPAEGRTLAALAADAVKIGEEYLRRTVQWWNATHGCCDKKLKTGHRRKFVAVGD